MPSDRRPDPEQLLRQLQADEKDQRRGRLKVFLGYAGGVGKSFRMLDEARRRQARGEDVVVGAIQPKVSAEVGALLEKMPVIPLHAINGVPTMDLEAILHRHPQVCLVDGLAYDNPPGSRYPQRWQDVEHLLSTGISVIATVNLQHIEERRQEVERITGKLFKETVPESFLLNVDEIEIVDAPPDFCLQRTNSLLAAGEPGAATRLPQQLSELRRDRAPAGCDVVDHQLEAYLARHGIEQLWGTHERILVCISPYADAAEMIASGKRNAERFHGELHVAYVNRPDLTPEERRVLEKNLSYALAASARIEPLDGDDPTDAIMQCARAHGITQIFLVNRMRNSWWDRVFGRPVERLIRAAENIDVRLFPVQEVYMPEISHKGTLKIFLGYAAGVGKTYQMLDEAQTLKKEGVDVVVGYFEPHGRKDTINKAEGLEFVQRRKVEYRGAVFGENGCGRHTRATPKSASSTSLPTRTCQARSEASDGKTSKCCWTPASTC